MIPFAVMFVVPQTPTAAQVMGRLATYIHSAHSLSADLSLSSARIPGAGLAKMVYVRPDQLCYTMKWSTIDYRFVGNSEGSWDANYGDKSYDETTDWHFYYPNSSISDGPALLMPGFLMEGNLGSDIVGDLKYLGKTNIGGIEADEVEGAGLDKKVDIFVAPDGKPLRYKVIRSGLTVQADLTDIAVNQPEPSSLFGVNPPLGFREATVPLPLRPMNAGGAFPVGGWVPVQNGEPQLASLVGQKPTFLMITTPGCIPSEKSAESLNRLNSSGQMNVAVGSLASNGAVPASLEPFPVYRATDKKILETVNAPGTPLFYLLGKTGKVVKIWYGYDADEAAAFEKDVLASLKGL